MSKLLQIPHGTIPHGPKGFKLRKIGFQIRGRAASMDAALPAGVLYLEDLENLEKCSPVNYRPGTAASRAFLQKT
jgi:hypothetical protein